MTLDGVGEKNRVFTWGLDLSGSVHGAGGIGGLLAMTTCSINVNEGASYWYLYDGNGNVGQVLATIRDEIWEITGVQTNLAARYEYDPYGNTIVAAGDWAEYNTIRFSTKWFDDETGLGYWGYRYYNPKLGRWISRDPLYELGCIQLRTHRQQKLYSPIDKVRLQTEQNLIRYVENNSINGIDLRGLTSVFNPCGCRVYRKEIDLSKLKDAFDPEIGNDEYEAFIGHTWIQCGENIYDFPRGFQDSRKEAPDWIWGTSKALLGTLAAGSGKGKNCACASCGDIQACLQAIEDKYAGCKYGSDGLGIFPPKDNKWNCRVNASKSLSSCCLLQNLVPDKAFGLGFDDPIWVGY